MSLSTTIDIASTKWNKAFPRLSVKIKRAAEKAFVEAKKPAAFRARKFEVAVLLTNDSAIKKLNRDYRGKDKPTNVLSFPQFEMKGFRGDSLDIFPKRRFVPLGDVVLAYETILRECRSENKSVESHTIHLVVHGILHLLGYDHIKMVDAKIMEKLESDILINLGYNDPHHAVTAKTGGVGHGRRA